MPPLDEPSLGSAPIVVNEARSIIKSAGRIVAEGPIEELRNFDLMRESRLGDRHGGKTADGEARPTS